LAALAGVLLAEGAGMSALFFTWLSLLFGKLGLGLVLSGAMIAAWWFIPEVPWLTARLRRGLLIGGIAVGALTLAFGAGAAQAISTYKAKLERERADAIRNGDAAREKALRDFDAAPDVGGLPDDGFRRP
jgi:hypothetical protein